MESAGSDTDIDNETMEETRDKFEAECLANLVRLGVPASFLNRNRETSSNRRGPRRVDESSSEEEENSGLASATASHPSSGWRPPLGRSEGA